MTKEKLKITLERKRVMRFIKVTTFIIESCLVILLTATLSDLDSNAEQAVKRVEDLTFDIIKEYNEEEATTIYDERHIRVESRQIKLTKSNSEINVNKINDSNLIKPGTVMYASANLNVRLKPDKESDRVGKIKNGDKIIVNEDTGSGWVQITYKDKPAYVSLDFLDDESPMILVSSTAYYDKYNRKPASMRELIEGHSIAGKVSWLNKSVNIYKCNEDGTIGEFIGEYTFDDTGYGAESGVGESKILKGRTIGTIENGTCIDFFFDTEAECLEYGRRNVYIQFID